MRSILIPILCAVMLLTSAGVGAAKGALPAADGIVICRGHGTHTVWINAQGEEIGHHALCADGVQSMLMLGALAQAPAHAPELMVVPYAPKAALSAPQAQALTPMARGPPLTI